MKDMSVIRVGYQGEYASNSERAAKLMANSEQIDTEIFDPCRTSEGVVNKLERGNVQYGVVAVENSYGGIVQETAQALHNQKVIEIARLALPITHSMFAKEDLDPSQIKAVYSHPQALRQCEDTLKRVCPDAQAIEAPDTGQAAYLLANDEYPTNSAVLCSTQAGELHGLRLIEPDMQDHADNITTFILFKLEESQAEPESEILASLIVSPRVIETTTKVLVAGVILAGFLARDLFELSSWDTATAISGVVVFLILFLTSKRRELWLQARLLGGYWKYTVTPLDAEQEPAEKHDKLRLVHIDRDDRGSLRFRGWRTGDGENHRWENKQVLTTSPGTQKGKLVYEYANTNDHADQRSLDGIVHLSWNRTHATDKVTHMSGRYFGYSTHDQGHIRYVRIEKTEFNRLRFNPD